jgi:site-specific DNA-methyltransferase (adenine-specific)
MAIVASNVGESFSSCVKKQTVSPLFLLGDALSILQQVPEDSIDCCITSPPYWGKRKYHNGGIGLEASYQEYISSLSAICEQVKRVLEPTGSFWLNIGDTYCQKQLLGIPWRVALTLTDEQGWVLRNSIIWNKVKGGPDNSKDRLRNVHENVFHFVKVQKGYYYNVDAIRSKPRQTRIVNGAVVSATGVTGVCYKRQIELSTALTKDEKAAALAALEGMLGRIERREIADFRMIIRGQQRTTHSDSERVSGRARELSEKGFYFLKYHPNGSKPSDVWDILPEDTQKRRSHFAPFPEDLCRIPILATCPPDGLVLDPFCGTGTTMLVARTIQRKSIGIDIAQEYLKAAEERCMRLLSARCSNCTVSRHVPRNGSIGTPSSLNVTAHSLAGLASR